MKLDVYEIFSSIQGESTYSGLPFIFIRLAGCNLRCKWCDTKKAQTAVNKFQSIDTIVSKVKKSGFRYVCVTGGEPLMQNETVQLLKALLEENLFVTLETNGSILINNVPQEIRIILDLKCPGSGMSDKINWKNLDELREHDEVKFIISNREDYEFALDVYFSYLKNKENPILIYPVWEMMDINRLAKWILSDKIPFRLNCQLHKIIGVK